MSLNFFCSMLVLLGLSFGVSAQISPGELANAHANLEGMSNCTKCHVLGEKLTNAKCLECHIEIKDLIARRRGYHASNAVEGKDCFSCHSDHHGRKFKIINFDKEKFDHKNAGYELSGKHKVLECTACHKPEFIKVKKSQKREASYLGLETDCRTCHADNHQNTISANCSSCHDVNSFKPASGFDHQKTKYQLTGKHARLECIKCHPVVIKNGKKFQQFAGIQYNNCTNCHKDVHENKFGNDCWKCHNVESFQNITGLKTFDHSKTNFLLTGKHLSVSCKSCHKSSYAVKMNHGLCKDCHSDYHKNQFTKAGISPGCEECHNTGGFSNTLYSIEKHNKTNFTLEGGHLATPCISCHKKEKEWKFNEMGRVCADCHDNIHKNIINEKYFPNQDCRSCHSISSWHEVKFDHNLTKFPLLDKHAELPCRKCHFVEEREGTMKQKFSGNLVNCISCHADVHNHQFDENGISTCEKCHGFSSWKVAVKFNHDNTRFKLGKSHGAVNCDKCHDQTKTGTGTYINYKINKIKCASCHS